MKCKEPSCRKEIIFCRTQKGKMIPVDFSSLTDDDLKWLASRKDENELLPFRYGEHITHFATCSAAKQFRSIYDNTKE